MIKHEQNIQAIIKHMVFDQQKSRILMELYQEHMSNQQNYRNIVILIISCFALAFRRLHETFTIPIPHLYPLVIPPAILKSSQPIGDDSTICAWH
jgi:hypothetical protein